MLIPTIIQSHREKKYNEEIEELCERFYRVNEDLLPNQIYFPSNVPSSKNGRAGNFDDPRVTKFCRAMLPFLLYQEGKWRKAVEALGENAYPALITYKHVRDTKRVYDYGNANATINDLLSGSKYVKRKRGSTPASIKNDTWVKKSYREKLTTDREWLVPDDNINYIVPCPDPRGYPNKVDKATQGVIVSIFSRQYWLDLLTEKFEY